MVSGLMLTTNGLDELPLVELWKPSNLAPSPWKSAIIELYGKKKKSISEIAGFGEERWIDELQLRPTVD
jgi:hypothetical protein